MTRFYQFVDSISEDAAVLLDLDASPFEVEEGVSVSPPTLRRATVQGIRQDGDLEVASSWDDRQITVPLGIKRRVPAESQATAIQTLARILDRRDGAWLKVQDEGMANPRFYRTRRASFETIDAVLDATPDRSLRLVLPADPFGYGLPETGSFTITNDPTLGTNKMFATFPEIMGDVAAPLLLGFATPDGVHKTLVASQADFTADAMTAPYYKSLSAGTINSAPPAGWTISDSSDSSMVSGTLRVMTKTSGAALCRPTDAVMQQWASLPPGDYRVLVRTDDAVAGDEILFFNRPPSAGSDLIRTEAVGKAVVSQTTTGKDWHDLGVVAMPGGAPLTDVAFGQAGAAGPALWNVAVYSALATASIALDAIMLIPAGRPGTITRIGSVEFSSLYTGRAVTWDGLNGRRFASGVSSFTAGVTSVLSASEVTGGNPIVAPGASNVLHFFATTADTSVGARVSDDKAITTTISWMYFPMYLYNRPTAT